METLIFWFWKYIEAPMRVNVFFRCAQSADRVAKDGAGLPALFILRDAWKPLTPREKRFCGYVGGWPIEPMERLDEEIKSRVEDLRQKQS